VREQYVPIRRRLEGAWEIYGADGRRGATATGYSVRVYEREELSQMMADAGLRIMSWYGALERDAEAFSPTAQEVVAVAVKD
jgi:hypothetical protein